MNSGTTTLDAAIPQQVLAQAASWLMLMQEGPLLPAQQRELERWGPVIRSRNIRPD